MGGSRLATHPYISIQATVFETSVHDDDDDRAWSKRLLVSSLVSIIVSLWSAVCLYIVRRRYLRLRLFNGLLVEITDLENL